MILRTLATSFFVLLGMGSIVHSQCPAVELAPPEVDPGDRYGEALAADGRVLIVGAPEAGAGAGHGPGAAFVFERESAGWEQATVLLPPTTEDGGFGSSVDVLRDRVVVGSPLTDGVGLSTGAAHIYEKLNNGDWELVDTLVASDATPGDRFGRAVAVFGPRIAVSAFGAVYLFERTGGSWVEIAILEGSADFGIALALSETGLLVGGVLYEEVAGVWQQTKAFACDCLIPGRAAITPDGKTVAIGVNGGAFVYEHLGSTWSPGVFLDTDPFFEGPPARVALRDDGSGAYASHLSVIFVAQNRIRAFDRKEGSWVGAGDFIPDAAGFGTSIAWSAGSVIGGAPQPEIAGSGGRVFVFEDSVETYGEGTPGSAALVPTIAIDGCPAPGADTSIFVLLAVGGAPGVLFIGTEKDEIPLNATTSLWVSSIVATVGFTLGGPPGAPGIGSVELPIGVPPLAGLQGFAATLQALIVDPFAPNGVSSTAGYRMWIR